VNTTCKDCGAFICERFPLHDCKPKTVRPYRLRWWDDRGVKTMIHVSGRNEAATKARLLTEEEGRIHIEFSAIGQKTKYWNPNTNRWKAAD